MVKHKSLEYGIFYDRDYNIEIVTVFKIISCVNFKKYPPTYQYGMIIS
jgi:hypothetical protein